jgi:hypothetical protein
MLKSAQGKNRNKFLATGYFRPHVKIYHGGGFTKWISEQGNGRLGFKIM